MGQKYPGRLPCAAFLPLRMLLFSLASLSADILAAVQATSRLEWAAVLTGFACVWLAARESLLNFPVAIISCLLYIVIYYRQGLYSDSGLQGVFIGSAPTAGTPGATAAGAIVSCP